MERLSSRIARALYGRGGIYAKGDISEHFLTASHYPAFGLTLGEFLRPWVKGLGAVLEVGPGDGSLAKNLIGILKCDYYIYDPVGKLPKVEGAIPIRQLPESFSGVVLANEVLDALPPDRFLFDGRWKMAYWDDGVVWGPVAPDVAGFLPKGVPKGQIYDLSPRLVPTLRAWARALERGLILIVDYGDERDALLRRFPRGSMSGYLGHLQVPWEVALVRGGDITHYPDFTLVKETLVSSGLTPWFSLPQADFLLRAGIEAQFRTRPMEVKSLLLGFRDHRVLAFVRGLTIGPPP